MFKMTLETGNAAFGPEPSDRNAELARMLRAVAQRIEDAGDSETGGTLTDHNGQSVGEWSVAAFCYNDHSDGDDSDVEEFSGTYGRGTPCTIYTFPDRAGMIWYAVDGSRNVNQCEESEIFDGVNVETVEDVDTFTAGKLIDGPRVMAEECADI